MLSGSSPAKTPSTPAKRQVERDQAVGVLPLAVRTLCKMHQSQNFSIGGRKIGTVVLVGTIESAKVMPAEAQYTIQDGTGRMLVKDFAVEERREFKEGQVVRIAGEARPTGEFYVSVKSMSEVTNLNEVGHHRIACVHTLCALDRADKAAAMETPLKTSPEKLEPDLRTTVKSEPGVPANLEQAVEELIKKQAEQLGDIGISIEQIQKGFPAVAEAEVKKAVQGLCDTGSIYTTIDDEHFAAC